MVVLPDPSIVAAPPSSVPQLESKRKPPMVFVSQDPLLFESLPAPKAQHQQPTSDRFDKPISSKVTKAQFR